MPTAEKTNKVYPTKLFFVAAGTGGCGTGYVAHLLSSAGITCGHEAIFGFYGPRMQQPIGPEYFQWETVPADSSWMASFHLEHPILSEVTVIHIVRAPLANIGSWRAILGGSADQGIVSNYNLVKPEICEKYNYNLKCPASLPLYDAIALRYLMTNDQIALSQATHRYIRYRVEDRTKLLDLLGIPVPKNVFDNNKYNSHRRGESKQDPTWDDIKDTKKVFYFRDFIEGSL